MENFLQDTLEIMYDNGKSPLDVKWVGTKHEYYDWAHFEKIADVPYPRGDSGYIHSNLVVVGDDWWLERHFSNYDTEWWEFHTKPSKPSGASFLEHPYSSYNKIKDIKRHIEMDKEKDDKKAKKAKKKADKAAKEKKKAKKRAKERKKEKKKFLEDRF